MKKRLASLVPKPAKLVSLSPPHSFCVLSATIGFLFLFGNGSVLAAATSYQDAMARLYQNTQTAPRAQYAWNQPYCLRYRTQHPTLLILGDSIFDGWSGYLLHVFPKALVDARVSRQFSSAIPIYRSLLTYAGIRSIQTVVVELGTNGPVTPEQIAQFMQLAGPRRRVLFIVPEVPRAWETEVQSLYERLPEEYPNVRLVYWNRLSTLPDGQENPRYFWPDGVHPNWRGIQVLVQGLAQALAPLPSLPAPGQDGS